MRLKPLFCILFCILSGNLKSQGLQTGLPDSLQHYIDMVYTILKEQSLFTNTVDWTEMATTVNNKIRSAKTIQDLMPAIEFLYQSLGDKHGYLLYKNQRYGIPIDQPLVRDELARGFRLGARVRSSVIENHYGYIFIPPIWAPNDDLATKFAQQIQDSVCALTSNRNIKGWIIDLRMNLGGNMYPMLAGIGNILGDGILGSFITTDSTRVPFILQDGDIYEGSQRRTALKNKCSSFKNSKVVVLLSQLTNSSGEIVAIAFKGRMNTFFIGENTAGYTTGNNAPYYIDKNSMLVVASVFIEDRNGHVYQSGVSPDRILIDGDNFTDLSTDSKIKAAIQWLTQQE